MWDANYVGVWHLDESGSGVLDEFVDSNGTGNHGQGGGGDSGKTPAITTNGQIGNAQDFDGTDDYVTIGNVIGTANAVTLSAWVKHDNLIATKERQIELGDDVVLRHAGTGSIGQLDFYVKTNGTARHLRVNGALSNGVRYHVAGTWDGTTLRVFLNGVERDSKTPGGSLGAFSGGNIRDADPTEAMDGIIDEDRISNIARSPDWIAAQHPR